MREGIKRLPSALYELMMSTRRPRTRGTCFLDGRSGDLRNNHISSIFKCLPNRVARRMRAAQIRNERQPSAAVNYRRFMYKYVLQV